MVEFVVRAPGLHPWDAVYVCGEADPLGLWQPDFRRLDWHDGAFRTHLDLPAGSRHRYLLTRGTWRQAELDHLGREHRPRELTAAPGLRVDIEVPGWGRHSVRYHPDFGSAFLPHPRTLTVHLPPEYDLHPHARYPVLYLHDGQNLFDAHTAFAGVPWRADETAERLARCGEITPVIQVGVANTPDRLKEYGPKPGERDDLSARYARFLTDEVKPFIDREYRTRPGPTHTGIGGSSMGGLISLHLCRDHPDVFGLGAALSPSLWWDAERLLHEVGDDPRGLAACRLWVDMGTREGHSEAGMGAMLRRAHRLAFHLRHRPPEAFRFHEAADGLHNEDAWAARYPDVLRFLFPPG
jgi:predicted alpha/beta superfamily hydrolase